MPELGGQNIIAKPFKGNFTMNTVTTMNTAVKTASVSLVVDNTKPLTMSTRQIAELTGKNHKDVMRDLVSSVSTLLGSASSATDR